MKKTIKMGVFGLGRGKSFYDNIIGNGGEVVAVCDMSEAKREEAKEILVRCMEQAASLSVPLSVEANVGNNWYDAK